MSLTSGHGPLSATPAGRFDFERPPTCVYVEPCERHVRARLGGDTVIDSLRVLLVHRSGLAPTYAFPPDDVRIASAPEPAAPGYVAVPWDAVDSWFEEDEEIFLHANNPYHRVDCLASSRSVEVRLGDVVLASATAPMAVFETALPTRWYLAKGDVRMDLLEPSDTTTFCPYKGTASYWSARVGGVLTPDVAWSYEDPRPESARIGGHLAFYDDKVTITIGSGR